MSTVRYSPYWKPGYKDGRATRHSESEFLSQHLKEKNWPGIHNWHFKWKRSQLLLYLNIITFFNLFILYWSTDFLEEGLATYSSILAWRIPWTEESGGLQSKGLPNSTWLKWISEHECKKKGNHTDHIIIKLMKFIKEKKSLQKLMKTNTVHFTYRNTKIRVISHLDKNYINHKIMKWHLMIACGLVLLNGSGEIVDLFL